MRVYLIGYMGCGKSTMGRKLSKMLNMSFIDLDKYIEEKFFKTIPQIFAEEGEASFREKERAALMEVSGFEKVIVATGGGAPCFFDNMEHMNDSGACVFLDVDSDELANRLIHSKTERPLIKGKSPEELVDFIEEMMGKRRPFYEKAHYVLKGKEITPEDVIAATGLN
ncbi:shikimate kinase [Sunxiuqinia sp. A32]|uniref:shikimate kinase n=1 Tax=Sunxiuqinia sp. A32 TaxID=3461496 RepID=UPI00404675C7